MGTLRSPISSPTNPALPVESGAGTPLVTTSPDTLTATAIAMPVGTMSTEMAPPVQRGPAEPQRPLTRRGSEP